MTIDQLISLAKTKDTLQRLARVKLTLTDYDNLLLTLPPQEQIADPELAQAIHKLKSPISAINGYIDLAKIAGPDLEAEKVQIWLTKLDSATSDLESQMRLIRSLLS